jgi:hypothetical protein
MAASITVTNVVAAPGGTVTINGSGLTGGGSAGVQVPIGAASTMTAVASPTFSGTSVSFTLPDGAVNGPLIITASDTSSATANLKVRSQYLFGDEYVGEGTDDDVAGMAAGELDRILMRASQYADSYISQGSRENMSFRLLQTIEKHQWRRSRRIYPWRSPIVSIDAFVYIASPSIQATFDPGTLVVSEDADYAEMVIWSVGYSYIQALASQTMADAGIVKVTYTAGYPYAKYPPALCEATTMIATELIVQRKINKAGMGALSRVRQGPAQYDRRDEPFEIPQPAKVLLDSLRTIRPS